MIEMVSAKYKEEQTSQYLCWTQQYYLYVQFLSQWLNNAQNYD
jgi:hypothetical protein